MKILKSQSSQMTEKIPFTFILFYFFEKRNCLPCYVNQATGILVLISLSFKEGKTLMNCH